MYTISHTLYVLGIRFYVAVSGPHSFKISQTDNDYVSILKKTKKDTIICPILNLIFDTYMPIKYHNYRQATRNKTMQYGMTFLFFLQK